MQSGRGFYRELRDDKGRPFLSWEEFVQFREPFGLGLHLEVAEAILGEKDHTKTIGVLFEEKNYKRAAMAKLVEAKPLHPHGTNQYTLTSPVGPDGHEVLKVHGTSSAYLAARIKREAPEIAARIHEFGSMAAAARAAGIKVPKPKRITLGDPAAPAAAIRAMGDDYVRAVISELEAKPSCDAKTQRAASLSRQCGRGQRRDPRSTNAASALPRQDATGAPDHKCRPGR